MINQLFAGSKAARILLLLASSWVSLCSYGQPAGQSIEAIGKWLSREPHGSPDQATFSEQYRSNQSGWDKAFHYLKDTDLANLKPGRYPIDGENVFALVSQGETKPLDKTAWESHKNYHDIHFVISGQEKIGITPAQSVTVSKAYDAGKDIAFYTGEGSYFLSDTSNFFIALTGIAHRPGVKADGSNNVKKIVIKVRRTPFP